MEYFWGYEDFYVYFLGSWGLEAGGIITIQEIFRAFLYKSIICQGTEWEYFWGMI